MSELEGLGTKWESVVTKPEGLLIKSITKLEYSVNKRENLRRNYNVLAELEG